MGSTRASNNSAPIGAAKWPAFGTSRTRLIWGALALGGLAFFAYLPVLRGEFVWDDLLLVEQNPLVSGHLSLGTIWFRTDFPLSLVALWGQWLLWGKNAAGYHLVNVALHVVSVVLVWRLLALLRVRGSWLGAALFAVHPVCVASVAWISELKNTLSLPFFLLSFLWYVRAQERDESCAERLGHTAIPSPPTPSAAGAAPPRPDSPPAADGRPRSRQSQGRSFWYTLSVAAFALALLAKTSTVMLPVVLVLWAWWRRGRLAREDWRIMPYFLLAVVFGLMTIWFQAHQTFSGIAVQSLGFAGRLAGAGKAVWFYLGKALLPLELNMIYPRWQIDASAPRSYLPLVLLALAFGVVWLFRRTWGRHVLFGLGSFTVSLFPALGFFDMYYLAISRVSDHFQYLALVAVMAVVGACVASAFGPPATRTTGGLSSEAPPPPREVLTGADLVGAVLMAALLTLTLSRARVFATDEGLWRDTLAKNPAAWPAHNNLACILAERGQLEEAVPHFIASLESNPQNAQALQNLGRALFLQGHPVEAEARLSAALQIKPDAATHELLAEVLASEGKTQPAIAHFREALSMQANPETRIKLAALLSQSGDARAAVAELRRAVASEPDSTEALNNLAWLLATAADATVRDGAEALRLAEQACRLTANQQALPLGTLAAACAETGRFSEAIAAAQRAIALARASGDGHFAAVNEQLLAYYRAGKAFHEQKKPDR